MAWMLFLRMRTANKLKEEEDCPEPLVVLSLLKKSKEEYIGKEINAFLNNTFYTVLKIFTDGSKENLSVKRLSRSVYSTL